LNPEQITPHTLRHTAVTHLVQAEVDLPTVQQISGRRTLAMVARYAHQSGSPFKPTLLRLEGRVSQTGTVGVASTWVKKPAKLHVNYAHAASKLV
jgi:hypothetical protein